MGAGQIIQILEIVLLAAAILVVGRLFFVLGDVQKAIIGIQSTRTEITATLRRVEAVAETTDKLMREELAPTLHSARDVLQNVEVTTRALAESTAIVRKVAGSVEDAQKFFSMSGPIAQAVMKKAGGIACGLLSGISTGLLSVLGRKSSAPAAKKNLPPAEDDQIAIPGSATTNPVLKADVKPMASVKGDRHRK